MTSEAHRVAEPVADLITLTHEISNLNFKFVNVCKAASRQQKAFLREVSGLTEVLFRAEDAASQTADSLPKEVLKDCRHELDAIKSQLSGESEGTGPLLGDDELKKRVDQLQQFRGVFAGYVSAAHTSTSIAAYRKTNAWEQRGELPDVLRPSPDGLRLTGGSFAQERLASISPDLGPTQVANHSKILSTINRFLQRGELNLSARDSQGWTPLHWACARCELKLVQKLVDAGADINAQDVSQWTPLFWLAVNGSKAGAETLLAAGASLTARDVYHWDVLSWAILARRNEVVELLLAHRKEHASSEPEKADLKIKDCSWQDARRLCSMAELETPLEIAASTHDPDLFSTVHADAFMALPRPVLPEPRSYFDHSSVAHLLWRRGRFDTRISNIWRTMEKAESMNGADDSYVLRAPTDDESEQSWRTRLLHVAIKDGRLPVVRSLLQVGTDPDGTFLARGTICMRTPLHTAAFRRDPSYVEALLEHGADPRLVDTYGQTPLHMAVMNGFEDTARALLAGGADPRAAVEEGFEWGITVPNERNDTRNTLMLACGMRSSMNSDGVALTEGLPLRLVDLILSYDVELDYQDRLGMSALHHSAMMGQADLAERFISAGMNLELRDCQGRTALHISLYALHLEVAQLLLKAGADTSATKSDGKDLIHCLADGSRFYHDDFAVLYFIRCRGLRERPVDKILDLVTTISEDNSVNAVWSEPDKCQQSCSQWKCTTKTCQFGIHTPLSLAIRSHQMEMVKLFCERGAVLPPDFDLQTFGNHIVESWIPEAMRMFFDRGGVLEKRMWAPKDAIMGLKRRMPLPGCDGWEDSEVVPLGFSASLTLLAEAGLDLNGLDAEGHSLGVSMAEMLDTGAGSQVMLNLGVDPRRCNADGLDWYMLATLHGHTKTLSALFDVVKTEPQNHWTEHVRVQSSGNPISTFCTALARDGMLYSFKTGKYYGKGGKNLFWLAVDHGNLELVRELIGLQVDVNAADTEGWSPLHVAAYRGHLETVEALLNAGADVHAYTEGWHCTFDRVRPSGILDSKSPWKGNALHLACMRGHPRVVESLIRSGADVNALTQNHHHSPYHGPTALHLALAGDLKYPWDRPPSLGRDMLTIARMSVDHGASTYGVADHITLKDVLKFEHDQDLWDMLRAGISSQGQFVVKDDGANVSEVARRYLKY